MAEQINRREQIIDTAAELFLQQGYNATSVRQITDSVGCTEAALYYHFKQGKRALLSAVVECQMPGLMRVLQDCGEATSLYELIHCYGRNMNRLSGDMLERMRWLLAEFPNLSEQERALFHERKLRFQSELARLVRQFVESDLDANRIAWVLICAAFGYGHLFKNMELGTVADFSPQDLTEALASWLASVR